MKKLTLIVSVLALLIGFSQCKKEEITPNNSNEGVFITLTAGYGQQDTKTVFNPTDGSFIWSTGYEYINVGGSTSGYLGQLSSSAYGTQTSTRTFSGTLGKAPVENETLYFFYLGKGNHAGAETIDFSNQDGTLANVTNYHIAIGSEEYNGQTSFSATLNMAMAIAYFDLSGFNNDSKAAEVVYLNGTNVYSRATVDYNHGTITGCKNDNIKVGSASSGMYVALIPSTTAETATPATLNFVSNSKNGNMTFLRGIQKGSYYSKNNGDALKVEAIDGGGIKAFSVSATKQVFFSKGNLQYQASTNTWRFAEHQYDFVGDATYGNVLETIGGVANTKCNNANIANNYEGWIDLFGWGTGNNPTQTSTTASDYSTFTDWGSNSISNGDGYNWRTLTNSEWAYLMNTRTPTTSGLIEGMSGNNSARYVKATVNNVQGVIIFPDNYTQPESAVVTCTSGKKPTYNGNGSFFAYFVVESGWDDMASAGAIFLPLTGYRSGTTIEQVATYGYYFSSDKTSTSAFSLCFYNGGLNAQNSWTNSALNIGHAVRLVRE